VVKIAGTIAGTNRTFDGFSGSRTGRLKAQASREYIYNGDEDVGKALNGNKHTMIAIRLGLHQKQPHFASRICNCKSISNHTLMQQPAGVLIQKYNRMLI
jgi:hypothetical protein